MNREPDTIEALQRAAARAAYHLLRAGVEGLRALEAVIEELGRARRADGDPETDPGTTTRQRIDLE
jgi:hypothetical protein